MAEITPLATKLELIARLRALQIETLMSDYWRDFGFYRASDAGGSTDS